MKKHAIIIFAVSLILFSGYAYGSTSYVGLSDSLDLTNITGFQFDVVMEEGFSDEAFGQVTLATYYSNQSTLVGTKFMDGAVPNENWDIFKVKTPMIGVAGIDWVGGNTLSPGILFSLKGEVPFVLDNYQIMVGLGDHMPPDAFSVVMSKCGEDTLYDIQGVSTPVPVPPTVILLGAGTLSLLAVRRRSLQV